MDRKEILSKTSDLVAYAMSHNKKGDKLSTCYKPGPEIIKVFITRKAEFQYSWEFSFEDFYFTPNKDIYTSCFKDFEEKYKEFLSWNSGGV